jgi:hypothetical protein
MRSVNGLLAAIKVASCAPDSGKVSLMLRPQPGAVAAHGGFPCALATYYFTLLEVLARGGS